MNEEELEELTKKMEEAIRTNRPVNALDSRILDKLQKEYFRRILGLIKKMEACNNIIEAIQVLSSTISAMRGIQEGLRMAMIEYLINDLTN